MSYYVLKTVQRLPISVDKAWDFFSSPLNLKEITPPYLGFEVTSDFSPETKMYPGMIITYIVKPLLGIPMKWMTEITQIKEKNFFIDEQRVGPYRLWHHQHHFTAIEGGVEMVDIVHYQLPLGFLGQMFHGVLVKPRLNEIFSYRSKVLEERFGVLK